MYIYRSCNLDKLVCLLRIQFLLRSMPRTWTGMIFLYFQCMHSTHVLWLFSILTVGNAKEIFYKITLIIQDCTAHWDRIISQLTICSWSWGLAFGLPTITVHNQYMFCSNKWHVKLHCHIIGSWSGNFNFQCHFILFYLAWNMHIQPLGVGTQQTRAFPCICNINHNCSDDPKCFLSWILFFLLEGKHTIQ